MNKIGRNDPCPCGSGKKYKKCCLVLGHLADKPVPSPDELDSAIELLNAMNSLRGFLLEKKPHIKEYQKTRKLHGEIIQSMVDYYHNDNFKQENNLFDGFSSHINKYHQAKANRIVLRESSFDLESREGIQAFCDILIYKQAPNMNCITEEFITNHRYRKQEKIEFLHSMLSSKLGFFEITGVDEEEGYASIKEVFTNCEYEIVDVGLSGNSNYGGAYLYTRIITYKNISFNSGLSLVFGKSNPFIKDFITRHKKDYKPLGELGRFLELYNQFSKDPVKYNVIANQL